MLKVKQRRPWTNRAHLRAGISLERPGKRFVANTFYHRLDKEEKEGYAVVLDSRRTGLSQMQIGVRIIFDTLGDEFGHCRC